MNQELQIFWRTDFDAIFHIKLLEEIYFSTSFHASLIYSCYFLRIYVENLFKVFAVTSYAILSNYHLCRESLFDKIVRCYGFGWADLIDFLNDIYWLTFVASFEMSVVNQVRWFSAHWVKIIKNDFRCGKRFCVISGYWELIRLFPCLMTKGKGYPCLVTHAALHFTCL